MDSPEHLELLPVEALRPERHAIDAGIAIAGESTAFDSAGIRLEGDLHIGCDVELHPRSLEHSPNRLRREEARRATTEENADDPPPTHIRRLRLDVPLQRVQVTTLRKRLAQGVGVEVAVRALPHAPGHVHVE